MMTRLSSYNYSPCSRVVLASHLQGEFTVEMQVEGDSSLVLGEKYC